MQESCFIANAKLTHTKEKPYQSQSTLKQNKAIFSKVYVYHEPCFIANATSIHTKEKPYQSQSTLKALMPITFSSPRAQPEVVHFLISNESPYFSGCKSKILALNSL